MGLIYFITFSVLVSFYGKSVNDDTIALETMSFSLDQPKLEYNIKSHDENRKDGITYYGNAPSQYTLGLSKSNLSLSFRLYSENSVKEESLGKTNFSDVQIFGPLKKRWFWYAFFQKYQGLYTKRGNNIHLFPNMEIRNYGASLNYFFSEEFDAKTTLFHFSNNKDQNGSLYLSLNFNSNKIKNDKNLMPRNLFPEERLFTTISEIKQNILTIGIGYSLTLTYNDFFMDLMTSYGIGTQNVQIENKNENINSIKNEL